MMQSLLRSFLSSGLIFCLLLGLFSSLAPSPLEAASKDPANPNILWIFVEDMSPWFASYGDDLLEGKTPHLDALAARGVLFKRAFVPAPVCSACRSAIIVGAMQTSTGTHQHRSSRTKASAIHLPEGIRTLPEIFREQGWFTFNQGKEDYNFIHDLKALYSGQGNERWENSPEGTPFFGQIQLKGGKANTKKIDNPMDPRRVTVPAYFPDHDIFKKRWAQHYDAVRNCDTDVGKILASLKADGLDKSTYVVFFTDHGANHSLRHKQMCYEGGVHVPLIIAAPVGSDTLKAGTVRNDLVSGLDISASTFGFAGIKTPDYVEGQDLFAKNFAPRSHVISARDRCDYTIDRVRTVRSDQFRYLRNYLTDRPLLQPQYRDGQDYVKHLRQAHEAGTLDPSVDAIWFGPRPAEELYDLKNDPDELNNLVDDPEFSQILAEHRALLHEWIVATGDHGETPENDAGLQAVLDQWKAKCVNPEFDRLRGDKKADDGSAAASPKAGPAPLRVLIVAGGCCHDYAVQTRILKEGIENRIHASVDIELNLDKSTGATFEIYEKERWAQNYDVVLHDECSANVTNKMYLARILGEHRSGTPAVNLHCAMHSYRWGDFKNPVAPSADNAEWFRMIGLQSSGHGPKSPMNVEFKPEAHPITQGMKDWVTMPEELYNNIQMFPTAKALASATQLQKPRVKKAKKGKPAPKVDMTPKEVEAVVVWTNEFGPKRTRIFNTSIGHYNATVADNRYLDLVARGILWSTDKIEADGSAKEGYGPKK